MIWIGTTVYQSFAPFRLPTSSWEQAVKNFDIIVVGAGSAGCALVGRLLRTGHTRVLLIEAGTRGLNRRLPVRMPVAWPFASIMPQFGWSYSSEPEVQTVGRRLDQPRGRLMGGTSSINGMMYSRGHRADYDGWAASGLTGWSFADVLPYFRRSENNWRGASVWHGGDGPLRVSSNPPHPDIYSHMIAAGRELGYAENSDFNGPTQEGFGLADFNVASGRRESAATAYLTGYEWDDRLTVRSGVHVTRVIIKNGRACGVEWLGPEGQGQDLASEVVLCGGSFNSPQLLMLSGIGDPVALAAHGIQAVATLPGVGRNLQDHPMITAAYKAQQPIGYEQRLRLDRLLGAGGRWLLGKGGLLSDAPLSVQGFVRALADSDRPDTQLQISHATPNSRPWFPFWRSPSPDVFGVAALQLRPEGRGDVRLRSADPFDPPMIRLGLLQTAHDRRMAGAMLAFVRQFFASDAMKDIVGPELMPGPNVATEGAVDAALASSILTGSHPVGTCAMGTDPREAVVDIQLRVFGVEGLRVADASVMPTIISGNTSAPAMMIGERAADFILGTTLPPDQPFAVLPTISEELV
ncbi:MULTISPECIES: GMC family oxidoreductase [unclassified Novosphingobium]|uniref:GMC family oxidoreductase n=1 Tax=unclassified Novosphingobium TaxID=2644732 RepID=UPI0025E54B71|nr:MULTISPECIES: GMC family oxidoreductase N-terminal domain-containing protein [unclassified Novosphingobium]